MFKLPNNELRNIDGGAIFYTPFDWLYKVYRTIKIKLLMKKVIVDWYFYLINYLIVLKNTFSSLHTLIFIE